MRITPPTSVGFSPDRSLTYWNQLGWLVPLTIWVTSGFTTLGLDGAVTGSAACGTIGPIGIRGTPMNAPPGLTNGWSICVPAG